MDKSIYTQIVFADAFYGGDSPKCDLCGINEGMKPDWTRSVKFCLECYNKYSAEINALKLKRMKR